MNRIKLAVMMTLGAVLLAVGCGSTPEPSGAAAGVGGGTTATTGSVGTGGNGGETVAASSGSVGGGGAGGSGPAIIEIGDFVCAGFETPIGRILGDDNSPINENGAIAMLRVHIDVPVGKKFVWVGMRYVLAKGGICNSADSAAVAFTSPEADLVPPQHPAIFQVNLTPAANVVWKGAKSTVTAMFDAPLDLLKGEDAWAGVKLFGVPNKRACVFSCDGGGADPNSFFSKVNATNTVDDCPKDNCDFALLSVSPDPQLAMTYHNDNREFKAEVLGYFVDM